MHKQRRVVVTGLGVVAPNAKNCAEFVEALRATRSGLRFIPRLQELGFACQVGGIPQGMKEVAETLFSEDLRFAMNEYITYAAIASLEAFADAGLKPVPANADKAMEDTGAIIGTGIGGLDTFSDKVYPNVAAHKIKRLGSSVVEQIMASGASARVGGLLGLGGEVTSNSSACNTGTEAIVMGVRSIQWGLADRMVVGGAEGSDPHIWSGFDSMRVLNRGHNHDPEAASRPLSASAGGFIPGSGAGILVIEELETALRRGAKIYAEIIGTAANSGGMRAGGSMTAPSAPGVQVCIRKALMQAEISPDSIDYINGHLTATMADPMEVRNWSEALELGPDRFPRINSTKSMIGHALGGAGAIESVATLLQMNHGFVHGSRNCEDFHPEVQAFENCVPKQSLDMPISIAAKASFGFGDVNSCIIFKKWSQ
ncbi:MAG TPA: beta-ketoacyl-[acyl-carrier-protein] synthase family protein [Oligoflexus sp.]|uniref:beta-ketoacyl-[acyl-carrier-protein] synthase family protein n=1 Tax=Oligoflexus sp. TaxID=1971216 RepID=UPI002D7FE020|nr:beta-ketoacyl-[acyl-carrier-protein] synthase family protein [Oligoflexus sp.]HET9238546.1 beta-ketoacyl-[acyl-carrier-protein] synthase family protein [Oligoflexus sp.]